MLTHERLGELFNLMRAEEITNEDYVAHVDEITRGFDDIFKEIERLTADNLDKDTQISTLNELKVKELLSNNPEISALPTDESIEEESAEEVEISYDDIVEEFESFEEAREDEEK